MFGSAYSRPDGISSPSHFKDSARNAIYQQLPVITSQASVRSAPSKTSNGSDGSNKSGNSIFLRFRTRSVRSAPSLYSSSTATIPEEGEPLSISVEQLVNDVVLHEKYFLERAEQQERERSLETSQDINTYDLDNEELYKISLGSELQYQTNEILVDWNLNVTRCKLMLIQLPMITSSPGFQYQYSQNSLPQLVGDLAQSCQLVLIQPHITDKELIYTFSSSNLFQEHNLDMNFKKSVAEISVKQSRLLQINERSNVISSKKEFLKFKFKETALRNYFVNVAAAATTAVEYKQRLDVLKRQLGEGGEKAKLSKDEKGLLWQEVRADVFRRAGMT